MRATAAANPDVMKLEQIGTSTLGKPILVIKMTEDARNVPDGTRAAMLFSRRSTTRASGSRPSRAAACPSGSPSTRTTRRSRRSDRKTASCGSCRSRTRTATTSRSPAASAPTRSRATTARPPTGKTDNRFWRKTLRDNNNNGIYGDSQDGVDPNRNYPAKRGIDEEGASNSIGGETYRGPYALSERGNLAVDRLQRRVKFYGNINYHTDGQLLLTPVSYTTDYAPPDSTIFAAMTGTDGDSAVFPYQPQRSSDLYESNGDTIDNGYLNYGIIGWTPEMDTCATRRRRRRLPRVLVPGRRGQGPGGLRQEPRVRAQRRELAAEPRIARRTSTTIRTTTRSSRPRTSSSTASTSPTAREQVVEAIVRKELGPSDIRVTFTTSGNTRTSATTKASR